MVHRFVRNRLIRDWVSLAVAVFAVILIHAFLVRLPAYLLSERATPPEVTPLTAPDWAIRVESVRPGGSSGAGALGRGVPAAPESH